MKKLRVLIACEESQAVTKEFRALGHDAYSCDILPCSGGQPEWHLKGDVTKYLKELHICPSCNSICSHDFNSITCWGCKKTWAISYPHESFNWDMIIAFPPCTHLAVSGAAWFEQKRKDGRRKVGIDFFMLFANSACPKVAIENPVGIMSKLWRKPDQVINPFNFGDSFQKHTCLWLKGLPKLMPTNYEAPLFNMSVSKGEFIYFKNEKTGKKTRMPKWYSDAYRLSKEERAKIRSKTFPGIAKAMAQQWGNI